MAIGLRVDNTGAGRVIVVWVHYGEDVAHPGEGLAVWVPDGEPDHFEDTTFYVEFAHRACRCTTRDHRRADSSANARQYPEPPKGPCVSPRNSPQGDPLITSDRSGVAGGCTALQIPHI
jgi:hypothetical protein